MKKKIKNPPEQSPNRCYRCDYTVANVYGGILTLYKHGSWCDGSPEMWVCPVCEKELDEGKWEPKYLEP